MSQLTHLLIGLAALACGRGLTPDPVAPVAQPAVKATPAPGSEPVPAEEAECARMPELACLRSDRCTLVLAEDESRGYRCRDSLGPCENGFRQRGDDADDCESKPGCSFVPGRCYCPPDVTCVCGGGPPPQCVEARAASADVSDESRRDAGAPGSFAEPAAAVTPSPPAPAR